MESVAEFVHHAEPLMTKYSENDVTKQLRILSTQNNHCSIIILSHGPERTAVLVEAKTSENLTTGLLSGATRCAQNTNDDFLPRSSHRLEPTRG